MLPIVFYFSILSIFFQIIIIGYLGYDAFKFHVHGNFFFFFFSFFFFFLFFFFFFFFFGGGGVSNCREQYNNCFRFKRQSL